MTRPAISPVLRIQLASIVILILIAGFWSLALAGTIPRTPLIASELLFGAFIVFRIVSIAAIRLDPKFHDDTPDGWSRHTLISLWAAACVIVAEFWLAMPYQGEAERLLGVLFCQAPVAVAAIATVQRPLAVGRSLSRWVVPCAVPVGVIGFYVAYPSRFTLPVFLFSAAFCALMLLLRSTVQATATMVWIAKGEADAQRDAKARFVASASHDLGQPLQSARLFFDQAIRGPDPTRRARAVISAEAAFDAVEQQLRLMNEHLRLEAGAVAPRIGDVALGGLIARVVATAEARAASTGIAIRAIDSREQVSADPALLERALSNLIENAVRHAKARRLLVGVRRRGDRVQLWVIDDGVGVAAQDVATLFDDYVQGSNHGDEMRGGFGLGLASVRRIAALMQGTAGLATNGRRGAAFFLELPRSTTQA